MKALMLFIALIIPSISYGNGRTTLEQEFEAIVPIEVNGNIYGSGFLYKKRYTQKGEYIYTAITATHVIQNQLIEALSVKGNKVLFIDSHPKKDISKLIFKSTQNYKLASVASDYPSVGTKCIMLGYPLGLELFLVEGLYLGPSTKDIGMIKASIDTINAMSGGPLVCNGKIVGILYGGYSTRGHPISFLTYITPVIGEFDE